MALCNKKKKKLAAVLAINLLQEEEEEDDSVCHGKRGKTREWIRRRDENGMYRLIVDDSR